MKYWKRLKAWWAEVCTPLDVEVTPFEDMSYGHFHWGDRS